MIPERAERRGKIERARLVELVLVAVPFAKLGLTLFRARQGFLLVLAGVGSVRLTLGRILWFRRERVYESFRGADEVDEILYSRYFYRWGRRIV